jgi:hypothetical protein
MNLTIERHSFFQDPCAGTLRFSEVAPPPAVAECEHQVCNCTKHVLTRPAGEPHEVHTAAIFVEQMGKYQVKLQLRGERVDFSLHWPRERPVVDMFDNGRQDHAYFWWGCSGSGCQVEITGTGENLPVNCSFGHVYFGNQVNISEFFNGHSPSRVVKLDQIKPEQVWVHHGGVGEEFLSFFPPEHPETAQWWVLQAQVHALRMLGQQLDATTPVAEIREQMLSKLTGANARATALGNRLFLNCAEMLVSWVSRIRDTALFPLLK